MQTELSKSNPPKRKRRWFQFSLRTLMIFTAVVAALSASVVWVVKDRDRLIQEQERLIQERDDALDRLNGPNVSMRDYKQGDTVVTVNESPSLQGVVG